MLQLIPGSVCDVCAEEYGPHRPPHSIPCGHVFCATCCSKIIEKTLPKHTPACPFCREQFTRNDIRLIRFDYSNTSWPTPQGKPAIIEDMAGQFPATRQEARFPVVEDSFSSKPSSSRRTKTVLETKVAKVAAKKCSVEEVQTLLQELTQWLGHDGKPDDQFSSLTLSAALLRAILINHFAHAEATKSAKSLEATLKSKLDQSENTVVSLKSELREQVHPSSSRVCNEAADFLCPDVALALYPKSTRMPRSPCRA
ncbi:hypothetical protein CONPUDRAFT_131797 [Coniophora puteana RWD-64-598 SS2]|uniref:RING-type domain-containing protein n=1 Tax=Coniophora puteana (strain RWD-64-598) TaxID=741705 RepID=A0A5M3MA93_CONPW|nr:uncharacterized protein CONPUDRAFT_131797 [Coniophora puteana RWD-64-598 SS2]EIW75555.1 hypothetical protein CONPUDRAFT_131797 [Coniophora puteana RWD-64-598 SS2]